MSTAPVSILVINPNSSPSITIGLQNTLTPLTPPNTSLTFYTGPPDSPRSINDVTEATVAALACLRDLKSKGLLETHDAFLVASYLPLVPILRQTTSKPSIGILEASITHSLLLGSRFAILTPVPSFLNTNTNANANANIDDYYPSDRYAEVHIILGTSASSRFAGFVPTSLGVTELREGDQEKVRREMKEASRRCVRRMGADVIILGCAGMAGMESLVREAVEEEEVGGGGGGRGKVRVVDGAKAGVEILTGLVRLTRE
ncbi:hypothetical protein AX17_003719 [Amanita inopinata Kibby_2008]|nr:hypothetical protein AX17_003719 [Amanita inopinata Kibby_2008]